MKGILKTVRDSVYNPEFYQTVMLGSTKTAVHYYVRLIAILAVILTIVISFIVVPAGVHFLTRENIATQIERYPADLSIQLEAGAVSVNRPNPFLVPLSHFGVEETGNAIVFDTSVDYPTVDDFTKYETYLMVAKHGVGSREGDKQISINAFDETQNFRLDKETLVTWGEKVYPFLRTLVFLFPLVAFVGLFLHYLVILSYLLLLALVIMLVLYLVDKNHKSYKQALRVTIYASTLPLIILAISELMALPLPPFLFTVVLVIVLAVNLFVMRDRYMEGSSLDDKTTPLPLEGR